jgi:hypothetical protein
LWVAIVQNWWPVNLKINWRSFSFLLLNQPNFFSFLPRGVRELRDEHLRDELEEQFKWRANESVECNNQKNFSLVVCVRGDFFFYTSATVHVRKATDWNIGETGGKARPEREQQRRRSV